MHYIIILISLFILEVIYFKIADRFNIIDKPNERSSHTAITLRGGGIVFYFAILIYFIVSKYQYPLFFLGLTMMTIISFLDDIFTLTNKLRLFIHFSSVILMAYQLNVFVMPWYYLIVTFIVIVGVINAYNFMDGINGITACYSLSVFGLMMLVNNQINFIEQDFLIYATLSLLVFFFFNFRAKAKCFAGDVGSVAIAFILLFALGRLIIMTENLLYILFLVVYGIDTVWTIFRRLYRKENIFEAHRSHLYQFLGNEAKINKLLISFIYGLVQFIIGYFVILFSNAEFKTQITFAIIVVLGLSILYLVLKTYIVYKYVKSK